MAAEQTGFTTFRREATGIQTAIAGMQPLVERARLLSANAEITSAHLGQTGDPFGIIARELVVIVGELKKLVAELDPVFHEVARITANWIKAEHRSERYGRLLNLMSQEDGQATDAAHAMVVALGDKALQPEVERRWRQMQARFEPGSQCHRIWDAVIGSRREMVHDLARIVDMTDKMAHYVERIGWIAVRQSHFTAIAARTEAAKVSSTAQEVEGVARDIYYLSDEIGRHEEKLRGRIMDLQRLAANVAKPLAAEIQSSRSENKGDHTRAVQ